MRIILFLALIYPFTASFGQDTLCTSGIDTCRVGHFSEKAIGDAFILHGEFTEYHFGTKSTKCTGSYSLGELHGQIKYYNKANKLIRDARYANGILNGEAIDYYASGHIKQRCLYINGKLQGDKKLYEDGSTTPYLIEKYKMGIKTN